MTESILISEQIQFGESLSIVGDAKSRAYTLGKIYRTYFAAALTGAMARSPRAGTREQIIKADLEYANSIAIEAMAYERDFIEQEFVRLNHNMRG